MNFECPYCGKSCDYLEITMEEDIRAIIQMQPVFGKNAHLVWAYCELFGVRPLKARTKKLRLLQEELKKLFTTEGFTYQKKGYRISQAGIADALNAVVHRHWTEHLSNHNYLKKCMIGIAEASAKTAGMEAEKDLRKKEARLQAGDRSTYDEPAEQVEPPILQTAPSLDPSRQGREAIKNSPPLTGGDKRVGELRLTDEQIEENKARVKALLKNFGG